MTQDSKLYIVRLWDWFDGWCDITGPLSLEKAQEVWNKETNNGTIHHNDSYVRNHYYRIFPASTRMLYTADD